MREFEKGSQKFVEINGQSIPYDGTIKFYIDTDANNWVVSSPFSPQDMVALLQDAIQQFSQYKQSDSELVDTRQGLWN